MEFNASLPVLVPAIIGLIVVSAAAAFGLAWTKQPEVRRWIRRAWIVAAVVLVGGIAIFWISTAMVQGPPRATVERAMQEQQQEELRQRAQQGGH